MFYSAIVTVSDKYNTSKTHRYDFTGFQNKEPRVGYTQRIGQAIVNKGSFDPNAHNEIIYRPYYATALARLLSRKSQWLSNLKDQVRMTAMWNGQKLYCMIENDDGQTERFAMYKGDIYHLYKFDGFDWGRVNAPCKTDYYKVIYKALQGIIKASVPQTHYVKTIVVDNATMHLIEEGLINLKSGQWLLLAGGLKSRYVGRPSKYSIWCEHTKDQAKFKRLCDRLKSRAK